MTDFDSTCFFSTVCVLMGLRVLELVVETSDPFEVLNHLLVESRLVSLDGEQVVAALIHDLLGDRCLSASSINVSP